MQVAARASGAAADSTDDVVTIKAGELRLLDAGTRASAQEVATLLHDDFVEFGSSGRVFDKPATVSSLAAEESSVGTIVREAGDFTFRRLGPDAVLVTYRVSRHRPDAADKKSLRSSLWIRAEAGWRLLFHQGTTSAERSIEES
ncbi:nuclear transport factor 2 family protein [Lichenifustis flavocetrariae]|uniref:DUF4440 domain-containing protein n=1 Tax=Lichenifustis flavocetrariae TaxID=2949735 RepID=A0AA42CR37_9HYPH|nr:DUF4440 domain-containing protein [Lichenifustis flavocetrariae]MCW6512077.1 DUF4440 domain-containing protein [Lichenifustis flavocetrariae]